MTTVRAKPSTNQPGPSSLLHAPFYPADVRAGEPVYAKLRGNDGQEHTLRVWRISPMGVELVIEPEFKAMAAGSKIDLTVYLGKQVSDFKGLVVESRHEVRGRDLIGVRWYQEEQSPAFVGDRRGVTRWLCGSEFLPTGVAPNPVRFNDFIHFRVREVSAGGLQVITSLRNKFLVPGMLLDSMISIPAMGQIKTQLRIVHARIHSDAGKDFLSLGVRLEDHDRQVLRALGQYVLEFGPPTSLAELRDSGLLPRSAAQAVDFAYVRTEEEYRDVLALRRRAYADEGKAQEDATDDDFGDIYDSRARILVARYKGETIASLRLIYHEPEDVMEHEQYVKLPESFPRKDELVEITRVCTHPDYRGGDLLLGLFKHTLLAVLQSGRQWILGSATEKLLPLYRRIGFNITPVTYEHEFLAGQTHHIFLGDAQSGMAGRGINPILWNILFADIWNLLDHERLPKDPMTNLRLALYRTCRPAAQYALWKQSQPRKRKPKK